MLLLDKILVDRFNWVAVSFLSSKILFKHQFFAIFTSMFEFDLHFTITGAYFAVARWPESESGSAGFANSTRNSFSRKLGISICFTYPVPISCKQLVFCVYFNFARNVSFRILV